MSCSVLTGSWVQLERDSRRHVLAVTRQEPLWLNRGCTYIARAAANACLHLLSNLHTQGLHSMDCGADAALTAWRPAAAGLLPQPQQQQQQQLQLQQQVGYTFQQPGLLSQALTHVSVFGVPSYQRLEFLGDAVLDLLVSAWLMQQLGQQLRAAGPG